MYGHRRTSDPEGRLARWLHRFPSGPARARERHDERRYSFVDATSFALMRSMRIKDEFVFDTDFSSAGFRELRAEVS